MLQYYNRGGGVDLDPKFVLRNKWTAPYRKERSSCKIIRNENNTALAIPNNFSGDHYQLQEMVMSMMEKSDNNYPNQNIKADRCKICGKEGKGNAIKNHIEANHIEGIALPCSLCEKTFRSRNALKMHIRFHHKDTNEKEYLGLEVHKVVFFWSKLYQHILEHTSYLSFFYTVKIFGE